MKKLLIILLFLTPFVSAQMDECLRVHLTENIPCTILSAFKPNSGCDENLTIFLENGTFFTTLPWGEQTAFCNATWNISRADTYSYNSSIETGVITVKQKDNMLTIIIVQIFIILAFIAIGMPHKIGFVKIMTWGLAIIEFAITVWMVYIVENGGSILTLLYINSIIVLIVGGWFGFLTIFTISRKQMTGEDEPEHDSWTKYFLK